MAAKTVIEMEGREARLFRAFSSIIDQEAKMERGLSQIGQASRRAAAEEAKLERAAKKVFESTRTPMEQYRSKMAEINTLLKRGKISQDEYGRAAGMYRKELDESGNAGEKAFGAGMLTKVAAFGAGLLSVSRIVGLVTSGLNDMDAAAQDAADRQKESMTGLGALAQLAGGDPARMAELSQIGKNIYAGGGAESLDEAYRTVFELQSANMLGESDLATRLYGIEDPKSLARSAGMLVATMGQEETGGFGDLVSKAIAGATPVTGVGAADILSGAARGGASAQRLGLTDEDLIAATSVVAEATGSGEEAGTRVTALLRSLTKMGYIEKYKGQDLGEMLQNIRGQELESAEVIELLGRQEAEFAFSMLTPERLAKRKGEITAAQETNAVEAMIATAESSPEFRTAKEARAAAAGEQVSRTQLGIQRNTFQATLDREQAEARGAGENEWGIWAHQQSQRWGQWAFGDDTMMEGRDVVRDRNARNLRTGPADEDETRARAFAAFDEMGGPTAGMKGRYAEEYRALHQAATALEHSARVERSRNPTLGKPDIDR